MISEYARQKISGGRGRLLIIGALSKNFEEKLWGDPRLCIWGATEAFHARKIPEDIAAIVFLRFIKHRVQWHVRKILGERAKVVRICPRLCVPGEVKRLIADLGIFVPRPRQKRKTRTTPAPVPIKKKREPLPLPEFVSRYADPRARNRVEEAMRLACLASEKGLQVSRTAIRRAYFIMRRAFREQRLSVAGSF